MGNLDKIDVIKKLKLLNSGTIFWFDLGAVATLNFSDGIYVKKSERIIKYINNPQIRITINKIDFSKGVNETKLDDLFKIQKTDVEITTFSGQTIYINNANINEDNGFIIIKTP